MKVSIGRNNGSLDKGSTIFDFRNGSIIKKDGVEIYMEYRLRKFFAVLYEYKNTVVTREELMNTVWNDVVVGDDSVTKAAFDLRKFFKSHDIDEFRIVTIPKTGYKLEVVTKERPSFFLRSLRVAGFVLLFFFALITIIRALNY